MSDILLTGIEALPLALARRVDRACCRFEDAWAAGGRRRRITWARCRSRPVRCCCANWS
jgi:hypothetical protein